MPIDDEGIEQEMYAMVAHAGNSKVVTPSDLVKTLMARHPDDLTRRRCRQALRRLIESGRCVYTYFGGSFVELPHREGAAND